MGRKKTQFLGKKIKGSEDHENRKTNSRTTLTDWLTNEHSVARVELKIATRNLAAEHFAVDEQLQCLPDTIQPYLVPGVVIQLGLRDGELRPREPAQIPDQMEHSVPQADAQIVVGSKILPKVRKKWVDRLRLENLGLG